ncbi:DeoR/GlpR family DNA-binding transcription regulator [Rugosimonospora acidiphila]|uniref:DeoR/GlpR family DNA-binding transcription regulator n=1 Tax=Rugosimonospora acidiphila TaxID=556531 RepID=A0ABP9SHF3_9ACTN
MLRHERLNALLALIARRGSLTVEDVISSFDVSPATARRDLDDLAAQQLIARTRGGAVAHTVAYDLPLRYKSSRHSDQKRRIARAAAEFVETGYVVGINGGTTNTEVARGLATRADITQEDHRSRLTSIAVVTNALNIANELAVRPQFKIIVVGGVLRPQSFELIGHFANQVLNGVTIDITFLGVDAFSPEHGAATVHEGEAEINQTMVERSTRVVVVADSSKLGRRAFCTICPATDIDALITDDAADPDIVARFRDLGVEVHTV